MDLILDYLYVYIIWSVQTAHGAGCSVGSRLSIKTWQHWARVLSQLIC